MRVIYHNRVRKNDVEEALGVSYVGKDALLKESDFVCILTPLTEETKHMISTRELKIMKKTAVLINTSCDKTK